MKINPEIFRGYDIRGKVGSDLSPEVMETLARAYATWLSHRRVKDVVVGYDSRETSEEYTKAVVKALLECGMNVFNIGRSLTQMVYWAQYHFKSLGAVMITASHNPREFNGMKLASGFSNTIIGEEVQEIRAIAEKGEFVSGKGTLVEQDISEEYINDLVKRVDITTKFKIAVDTANGTPGLFAKRVFDKIGAEVIEFNTELDGSMPLGTPDPTESSFLERLSKETLESKADIGVAYDTDGDRFGMVDEKGNLIWNDVLVAIFAEEVLLRLPGAKIIFNALCSKVVPETIKKYGGQPIMWLTGHSYIEEKVHIERSPFGGELSGHMFFKDNFYGHEDGFFTTLRLLEFLSHTKQTVSQVVANLPHYTSSPEIKIGTPDKSKIELIAKMAGVVKKEFPNQEYNEADGIRVDFPDSMLVLRASQNGPYITVKFEAASKDRYEELRAYLRTLLHSYPEIDWSSGVNTDLIA